MNTQPFYNTIGLSGDSLIDSNEKALKQEQTILKVFKEFPNARFTPYDVQYNVKRIYGIDYLITSVRRALTNLTYCDHPKLIKSEKAEGKGIYKVPNHVWTLNRGNNAFS